MLNLLMTAGNFPKINLPRKISMVTSERRKRPPMTVNVAYSWGFWILDTQGKRANQVSSVDNNMKLQKVLTLFFPPVEKKNDYNMANFTFR